MLTRLLAAAAAIAVLVIAGSPADADQQLTVGNARVVVRTVTGTIEAELRRLQLKDDVYHNELIETAKGAATEIIFLDDTKLALGPESRLTLDRFVYDPNPKKAAFVITATKGAFRFASGKLPKASYTIHTPTATIGIRGTVFTVTLLPADPNDGGGDVAVNVAVEEGIADITTCRGERVTLDGPGAATTIFGVQGDRCSAATPAAPRGRHSE